MQCIRSWWNKMITIISFFRVSEFKVYLEDEFTLSSLVCHRDVEIYCRFSGSETNERLFLPQICRETHSIFSWDPRLTANISSFKTFASKAFFSWTVPTCYLVCILWCWCSINSLHLTVAHKILYFIGCSLNYQTLLIRLSADFQDLFLSGFYVNLFFSHKILKIPYFVRCLSKCLTLLIWLSVRFHDIFVSSVASSLMD